MLIFPCFILLFADLTVAENSNSSKKVHWLILHYHKTGHDLTRAIFEPLSSRLSLSLADNKGPRRALWDVKQYQPKAPYFQAEINIQGGADLHYKWNDHHPPAYKVIHFVRDPFEYVVSAYLYHAQQPPPPEKFVRQKRYNPCAYSQARLDLFVQELVLFGYDGVFLHKSLNDTIQLCNQVHKHGPLHQELRHLALQSTDEIGALQLEAARAIIADEIDAGGDILRMVANSLREKEAGYGRARRVFLNEFSLDNATKWQNTMTSVFKFLFDEVDLNSNIHNEHVNIDGKNSFSRRQLQQQQESVSVTNISSLVDFAFKRAFISNTSDDSTIRNSIENSGVHVTSSLVSKEKRLLFIKALEKDRVLGPLLQLCRRILDDR